MTWLKNFIKITSNKKMKTRGPFLIAEISANHCGNFKIAKSFRNARPWRTGVMEYWSSVKKKRHQSLNHCSNTSKIIKIRGSHSGLPSFEF